MQRQYKKITVCFLLLFFICSPLHSGDFADLYNDLVNFWHFGKRPIYLGVSYYIEQPGIIILTENDCDFAINGNGFFVLYDEINKKELLTRNGRFHFNVMTVLVNEDGYFVLNKDGKYIEYEAFSFQKKHFQDDFLLVMPIIDSIDTISDKYIIAAEYELVDCVVYNNVLEAMSVSLEMLLDAALLDIENNKEYDNKHGLIEIIYRRYYEIVNFGRASEDYYQTLLEKIIQFEELLLKK